MANTNKQFQDYNNNLSIPSSKRTKMNEAREASRTKITNHFNEHHSDYPISFWIQGSHKNGLNIRTEDDNCDQDDGIYINRDPNDSVDGTTLMEWVYDAIKDDTSEGAQIKNRCVRKFYKPYNMGSYHIDYPVYYKTEDIDHPMLAVKNEELEESDPQEFTEWLQSQKDENGQLVRNIKYLKGWCGYMSQFHEMVNGLTLSVLVCNNVVFIQGRDDKSLYETLLGVQSDLINKWECKMPSTPFDDLLAKYDYSFQKTFMAALDNLITDAKQALNEDCKHEASKLWKKHLGTRYPLAEKKVGQSESDNGKRAALAGLVGNNKPYYNGR